jgi:PAS domain S-box-containing protein
MKRTRYLANWLTTTFTLAVILPLVVSGLIFGWVFFRFSNQSIQTRQDNIVEMGQAYVNRYFSDLLDELALIAGLTDRTNPNWINTAELICKNSNERYLSLFVLDESGNEIAHMEGCRSLGVDTQTNHSSEEAFFRAARGELFVGNILFNEEDQPVATISFSMIAQKKQKVVIIGRVDLGNIWEPLNALDIGEGGYIYVVDRRGNLVGYRDPEFIRQAQNLAALPSVAPLLVNQPGVNALTYKGLTEVDVIGSSIVIDSIGWGLVLEQPVSEILTTRNQLGFLTLAVLLAFSVVAILVALYIARSIVTPIQRLAAGAEAIAREDFSTVVDVGTQDEIGLTAKAFNQMTVRLRELIQNMEQRVAERTKALSDVAEISSAVSTVLNMDEMLANMVHMTQRKFNLYHAHVFIYSDSTDELKIAACGWKGGDEREGVHGTAAIPLSQEQSLVARAARTKQAVIINDVRSDPGWLSNPLLPDTASEMAIPLLAGDKVLGVLDVQSDRLNAFTEADANIQTTLAAQVATSIQNIRQYEEVTRIASELTGFQGAVSEAAIVAITDVSGRIEYANENFERISKYSLDELLGQDHRILNSDYHTKEFIRDLWVTIANGRVWRGEIRNKAKDGSYYWVDTTISPVLNEQGKPVKYVAVRFDITQRKETELAVEKRAAELEVVANVSTAATTIIETGRLLQEVVDLTKHSFNLYHAHIYLLNETGDVLELTAGAGDVGKQMVAEGRSIPLDREQSLVARAARERKGFFVNNVRSDPDFLPHPALPETRAELAVPMIVGDSVLGVFDVQADQVDYFSDDDIRIQTTLAAQVAVALQNARTFSLAQRQAEREAMLNLISQKIQSATSVEAVLQIAARELGHALGAPRTIAQLSVRDGKQG